MKYDEAAAFVHNLYFTIKDEIIFWDIFVKTVSEF